MPIRGSDPPASQLNYLRAYLLRRQTALRKNGQLVTRENYIALAYPDGPPSPWLPEHEAELPEELQDWSQFEMPAA